MFNISKYLERFKSIGIQESEIQDFVRDEIRRMFSFDILKDSILIKDGIITLKGSSVFKSQIFVKKSALIKNISTQFPSYKIHDIR